MWSQNGGGLNGIGAYPHCDDEAAQRDEAPITNRNAPSVPTTIIPAVGSACFGIFRTVRQAATGGTSYFAQLTPGVISKPGHAPRHST